MLDENAFYDRKKKETVRVDIGEDIVANFKFIDFYFSPETHRLAFFDNQPVNSKQVEKYFQQAGDEILGEGQVNVTFETDRDIIERILNTNYVESLMLSFLIPIEMKLLDLKHFWKKKQKLTILQDWKLRQNRQKMKVCHRSKTV